MIPKFTSTSLSHEPEVGVKVQADPRVLLKPLGDV
jgi:hypothetical protein